VRILVSEATQVKESGVKDGEVEGRAMRPVELV
jgi:hypothetical protein